jgi:hypothetical protein
MERPREKCDSMRALCKSMDIILGSSAAIRRRMGHRVMQPPTVGFASIKLSKRGGNNIAGIIKTMADLF